MRIPGFSKCICKPLEIRHKLQNCTVVIDAQNFFYDTYKDSKLPFYYGCNCNDYAQYLKEKLKMFTKANLKCYFIFKGGHEKVDDKIKSDHPNGKNFEDINRQQNGIVLPVFMKDVYKEVLEEMGFKYVVCEVEAKQQCIALAQELNCPILSNDIEFVFSGCCYIPYTTLAYNGNNEISCFYITLNGLKNKFSVTDENIVSFILLTDERIYPKGYFDMFLPNIKKYHKTYFNNLFHYISNIETKELRLKLSEYISNDTDKIKFEDAERRVRSTINQKQTEGIAVRYLKKEPISFQKGDDNWLEKGVILKHIAIEYVNLYRHNVFFGSWSIEDANADDALLLSLDVIAYVYNILNDYQKPGFDFYNNKGEIQFIDASIGFKKLKRDTSNPFKNGYDAQNTHQLMEHFVNEIEIKQKYLDSLSGEEILMISLAYFARKKGNVDKIVFCVLLCKVLLDHESFHVNMQSFKEAQEALEVYFIARKGYISSSDRRLLHPLVEFQHCLHHINYLNRLCGNYPNIIFNKTYNATFIYNLYSDMYNYKGTAYEFLQPTLGGNPVLRSVEKLFTRFKEITTDMSN